MATADHSTSALLKLVGAFAVISQLGCQAPEMQLNQYRGILVPSKQVTVTAALDAPLKQLKVKKGAHVASDEPLAVMDDEVQEWVVKNAQIKANMTAVLRVAESNLQDAQLDIKRCEQLLEQLAVTEDDLRKRRVIAQLRESELTAAREECQLNAATWRLEEARLKRYRIKAPFTGSVVDVVVQEGATLARGDPILVLADLQTLQARLNLPVSLSRDKLRVGDQYRMNVSGSVRATVLGTLTFIRNVDDPGGETYYCEFDIPNPGLRVPAGLGVELIWPQ